MTMEPIRVVFAEDNAIYFEGLQSILDEMEGIVLCGAVEDGAALVDLVREIPADVVITDLQMPKLSGAEATRMIVKAYPMTGVIGLTMYSAEHLIVEMLEAGARGYLDKNTRLDRLRDAIVAVHEGCYYHCPSTTMRLSRMIADSKVRFVKDIHFTEQELALIELVCREYSSKQIAGKLFLSESSVDKHRKKIQDKMGVKSTAGMVVYAMQRGLFRG